MLVAQTNRRYSIQQGLTTIELILSIGIITVLFAISAPIFRSFLLKNDLEVSYNVLNQSLYRAQSLARNGERDSDWGVRIQPGSIVLFMGNSYTTRNSAFDEVYSIPSGMVVIGTNEYVYQKFSGLPIAAGSTTLYYAGDSHTSTMNTKGMIEQQ
jgi:Tfp pilus assembly protein FimT